MVLHVVTSHHVWLYINTHLSVYSGISLCYRRLYMYITVRGYTCIFTLKATIYTVLHTPALTLHHMVTRMVIPLHVWLYIKHMVIHIYLFHCTSCGYTRGYALRYTVISVISRIYTYVIDPYIVSLFQHRPLCFVTAFSKYVSTLFFIHTYGHIA